MKGGGGEGFMCSEMVEKCACVYLRLRLPFAKGRETGTRCAFTVFDMRS